MYVCLLILPETRSNLWPQTCPLYERTYIHGLVGPPRCLRIFSRQRALDIFGSHLAVISVCGFAISEKRIFIRSLYITTSQYPATRPRIAYLKRTRAKCDLPDTTRRRQVSSVSASIISFGNLRDRIGSHSSVYLGNLSFLFLDRPMDYF